MGLENSNFDSHKFRFPVHPQLTLWRGITDVQEGYEEVRKEKSCGFRKFIDLINRFLEEASDP